ncbi:hypothetical protein DFQ29_005805 [Apophysomyces sp. BC1021]|nr:hypothetical protein DFQ29_005805 [Apophysomyces sp. BC1021]
MPSPQPGVLKRGDPETLQFLSSCLTKDRLEGMKTNLYGYQKRSLWKMLQRELAPQWIPAPEVVEFISVDNIPYYFNQLSYTLTITPCMESDVGGGVICEDMGTGKTCICLSAIMATRHLPNPLDFYMITDLMSSCKSDGPKPLWAIAADQALRYMLNWEFNQPHYSEDIIDLLRKYPAYYEWSDVPVSFYERARRRDLEIPVLRVYASYSTLVVDEGHRLSAKNKLSELSAKLFANWKWVCTGTPTQNLTESATVLTRHEGQADDLSRHVLRLGILVGKVLNLQPFGTNQKLWNQLVTKAFMKGKPWAINNVAHLMERTMIRNQRNDVEEDVKLPPLYRKQVFLDFDYYQWVAHNCQIAMIGLNAILSKREGPDYLFSKNNKKALHETVHNLWQSCLWHSVDLRWLKASYENCYEKIQAVDSGEDDYGEDEPTLRQIKEVLGHALNDKMFMRMMSDHSPSFIVIGLPKVFVEKWGWLGGQHGAYNGSNHCIVNIDTIAKLIKETSQAEDADELYVYNGAYGSLKTINRLRKEKKESSEDTSQLSLTYYTKNAFSDVIVACSTSSKINYLVDQICKYHQTEKCIIFSQHYNEIQEIYVSLQIARVRALMYLDSHMTNSKRSQTILTFNTSDNANVIVMAVQKAAYGIDLSSATRVYFVSPVWQTAMELQAIKRAHRIGQTKPVYVETLVIRNSIEHELLKRRQEVMSDQSADTHEYAQQEFYSDTKLRNILNHARFVPLPAHITDSHCQPIRQLKIALSIIPRRSNGEHNRPILDSSEEKSESEAASHKKLTQNEERDSLDNAKRQKKVHFATVQPITAHTIMHGDKNESVEEPLYGRKSRKRIRFADAEPDTLQTRQEEDEEEHIRRGNKIIRITDDIEI